MVGDLASYYEHRIHSKNESNKKRRNNKERSWFLEPNEKQEDIDARACVAIKDLFPKVPDEDIKQIISRAFQKAKIESSPQIHRLIIVGQSSSRHRSRSALSSASSSCCWGAHSTCLYRL